MYQKRMWKFPALEAGIGITTNSFAPALKQGQITLEDLLKYFAEKGFSWVELRDQDGNMTAQQCEAVRSYAQELGLSVHYAWNNVDIIREDLQFFEARMACAAVFGSGRFCRIAIAPELLKGKYGYSEADLELVVPQLEKLIGVADKYGVTLCFENALEPIMGSADAWGMEKLYGIIPNLHSTLDAANFTYQVKDNQITTEDLLGYYERNRERIPYYHMKTSRQRKEAAPYLENDGDFTLARLLGAFDRKTMICLELPPQQNLEDICANVEQSLKLLDVL